jgi:hypothetical protein
MPPPDLGGEGGVPSSVGSDPAATESSSAADIPSLIERALAKLPPELREQAVDTKRKAKSKDPGWKYGWWPDPTKKDFVQCIFCKKVVPSGICRFKQHLAGGRGDAMGCQQVSKGMLFGTGIQSYRHLDSAEKRRKQLPQVSHQLVLMLASLCMQYSIYRYIYIVYICPDI